MKANPTNPRPARRLRTSITLTLATVLVLGAGGAAVAAISGPDASSWQHPDGASVNWNQVRDSGQAFAFIKATEGSTGTYVNPHFAADARAIKAAGMYLGTYHYARPTVNTSGDRYASATDQAQFYVRTLGAYAGAGNLPPALDYEDETTGLGAADLVNWAQRWLDTVQQLTGRTPIVYAGNWYWSKYLGGSKQFAKYPLWVAQYTDNPAPTMFGGWSSWTFWQYTDHETLPGIQGKVDVNRFSADSAALARLAGGSGPVIPNPTQADLQVSVAAPLHVLPGQSFTATLTVTNHGLAAAASTTASLVPVGAFTVTARGRGSTVGAGTDFTIPALPAGRSKSFTVTVRADGALGALLAYAIPTTQDPDLLNNFEIAPVLGF